MPGHAIEHARHGIGTWLSCAFKRLATATRADGWWDVVLIHPGVVVRREACCAMAMTLSIDFARMSAFGRKRTSSKPTSGPPRIELYGTAQTKTPLAAGWVITAN